MKNRPAANGERRIPSRLAVWVACWLVGPGSVIDPALMAAMPATEKPPRLRLSVDKKELTIGELLLLKLEVTHSASEKLTAPFSKKSLGEWAVRDIKGQVVQQIEDERVSELWECHLSIYRTGEVTIPSIEVELVDAAGKRRVLATDPIAVTITSVLTPNEEELKEIKPQALIVPDYKPFLLLMAALAAAALLLAKLVSALRKRGRRKPKEAVAPASPPDQIAREAIERLLSRKLIEQGRIKQFYLEISEIIKRYLGATLNILSLERTTEEFVRDILQSPVSRQHCQEVREFLLDCDSVKFAKYIPSPEENRRIVDRAFEIIDRVKAPIVEENHSMEVAV